MPSTSLADLVAALPAEDSWGPSTTGDNMLSGVPYAPFSKGDKLGRMADWTAESKDRQNQRPQYNRGFRGMCLVLIFLPLHRYSVSSITNIQTRPTGLRCRLEQPVHGRYCRGRILLLRR